MFPTPLVWTVIILLYSVASRRSFFVFVYAEQGCIEFDQLIHHRYRSRLVMFALSSHYSQGGRIDRIYDVI